VQIISGFYNTVTVKEIIMEIFLKAEGGEPCTRSHRGRSGSPRSLRPSAAGLIGTPRTRCFGLPSAKEGDKKHH
jgi:hypothetical protein